MRQALEEHMKNNMKRRLAVFIVLIGTLCFVVMGIIINRAVGKVLMDQCKEDAMGIALIATKEIDGDTFGKIQHGDDPECQKIYDELIKYESYSMIYYIYTMKLEGDHAIFAVDVDSEDPTPYGEPYELNDDMRRAFEGEVSCDQDFMTDEWGTFLSGYAPIFDSDGKVVGIVGCDITADRVNAPRIKVKKMVAIILFVFSLMSLGFYWQMSYDLVGTDFLTDIDNYERFIKKGKFFEKRGLLKNYTAALVNIKDFKYLNQSVGASRGDRILFEYAQKIKSFLNKNELIARTGNDNFMILLKKGREEEFLKFLSDLEIVILVDGEKKHFPVYSRCGLYQVEQDVNIQQIMTACTMAVNEARESTVSDFIWFEQNMMEQMLKEKEILAAFPEALKNEEFVVYYQPKVNMKTNELYGGEALVRWIRDGKMVPPDSFIPFLEKTTKITELDFYVFEKVCKNIRIWQEAGITPVRISSNFSRMHLANPDFAKNIVDILKKYEVDPQYVEIELTESSGYSDFKALSDFVDLMKAQNIHTSIDDFGTGYTSLSLLKDLDVDVVKIDKSFFRNMESKDETDGKMVENVIHMIQDLNREVICEGVETELQADFLKNKECFIAQGYLYDKPLQQQEFEERLRQPIYE